MSQWVHCYSRDEEALSSSKFMVQFRIKVYKVLSQPCDIWKQSFALMLSWAFLSRPKLRLLNRLGLSSIPLKERVEHYIYGLLELLTGFSATAGCNFLAKKQKNHKMHWTKKSKTLPSLLIKTENQRLNSRKPANRGSPQNWKTADFKSENRKTEPNIGQSRKTNKSLRPPPSLSSFA